MALRSFHPLASGCPPMWASAWGQDRYGPWCAFRIDDVEQRLRWMPPGRFMMGSPEDEGGRWDWEGPRHEVHLTRGFWLFDTPCTQALWQVVMDTTPSRFEGAMRPVEQVSWADAQAFITKLNEQLPGTGLRLPTEAQWEYACRAGTQTSRYAPDLDALAWYAANSGGETHEVGQKCPNAWGLYDMLGNVDEWCDDGSRDYELGIAVDPVGPTDADAIRVVRGGCWYGAAQYVRAALRLWHDPGFRSAYLGFRCASSDVS